MKAFGQALALGVLFLTFAGCDEDEDTPTINVGVTPDGGLADALPNADADGAVLHCRAFGQLGVQCIPSQ